MNQNIECNVCGGTDFYNEAGFYFCNECQTQTQEIREQVYDQQDNTVLLKTARATVRHESTSKDKLTSWEILNYILHGLAEELVGLGVNSKFKEICYNLWLKYLKQLEIMSRTQKGLPKLSACFRKRDAEIIYNRSFKRKRIRSKSAGSLLSSTKSSTNPMDLKILGKERTKQKRKLVEAEYDEYSNAQSSDTSLHNQTLSSLGSSDGDKSKSKRIVFTKAARKELLKHMTKSHLQSHINDIENKLTCHQFSRRKSSPTCSQFVITRTKLYSLVYLALLLSQDKFQLSDIIRFCREGHLSYLEYKHFFPDFMSDNCIDESVYLTGCKHLLQHDNIRKQTWQIYQLLDLKQCDFSPDLVELCRRYCTELNLPNEIFNVASNFIVESRPKFQQNELTNAIPNYEGRVMAFIIFTLKVLFGLDGATEYESSNFARLLNEKQSKNMFVFDDWYNYIQYRKLVLKNAHFPTKFLLEPNSNDSVELYVKFVQQRRIAFEMNEAATLPMKIAKKYLNDLEIFQENYLDQAIVFKPSITPFKSYIDTLKSIENFEIDGIRLNYDILQDRKNDTIDFLMHPASYFKIIDAENCVVKNAGMNTNHKFSKLYPFSLPAPFTTKFEQNWKDSFKAHKKEQLKFENIMDRILKKRLQDVKNNLPPAIETIKESESVIKYVESRVVLIKNKTGRDKNGRFCSKSKSKMSHTDFKPSTKGKWFVSSWRENSFLQDNQNEYKATLHYQVKKELERKQLEEDKLKHIKQLVQNKNDEVLRENEHETMIMELEDDIEKSKNEEKKKEERKKENVAESNTKETKTSAYKTHYVPWLEYWINVVDINTHTSGEKWDKFKSSLPKNFLWLLEQGAIITEERTSDLFAEFANVELYMCYVHLNNAPIPNHSYNNETSINRMIRKVRSNW